MKQYLYLCHRIISKYERNTDEFREDRTGTGTTSLFGHQMRFDLSEGFPMVTTKSVPFRLIASELIWFLQGKTNIDYLLQHNNHIWDEWAFEQYVESLDYNGADMTDFKRRIHEDEVFMAVYEEEMKSFQERVLSDEIFAETYGDLGPVYGKQWRSWEGANGKTYDQIAWIIEEIKRNPNSRRLIVSSWNVADVMEGTMALPPCHTLFQFYVEDGKLSCQLYQRSVDVFLGLPFNIASYALLTHIIAKLTGLEVGEFIHTSGDVHIYSNHVDQIYTQLSRKPHMLPTLKVSEITSIDDLSLDDLRLENYVHEGRLKGAVAI